MKDKILEELYASGGEFISGQALSKKHKVSRTAIWKHINNLKKQGYHIESMKNRGYRLLSTEGKLLPAVIKKKLKTRNLGKELIYFDTIDSTNNYGRKIAPSVGHGTIILSDGQAEGKGRMGRGWVSIANKSLCMSIILKPKIPPTDGAVISQIAAAASLKAIGLSTGLRGQIKWPNDIVIGGKKVCGILTEMAGELNQIEYLIVGIGINANNKGFPKELEARATSLAMEKGEIIDRQKLIINLIEEFEDLYQDYIDRNKLEKTLAIVRENSAILGRDIYVISRAGRLRAKALDIDNRGLLRVRYQDGREESLLSGEVSIRGEGLYT